MNYIREGTGKCIGFLVHDMKEYRGKRDTAPHILGLNSRKRRMVNFTLRPFHLGERTPVRQTHLVLLGWWH